MKYQLSDFEGAQICVHKKLIFTRDCTIDKCYDVVACTPAGTDCIDGIYAGKDTITIIDDAGDYASLWPCEHADTFTLKRP